MKRVISELDSSKSRVRLGWKPTYAIDDAIQKTISWYRKYYTGTNDMYEFSLKQVNLFMHDVMKQK